MNEVWKKPPISLDAYQNMVGHEVGVSSWHKIDQEHQLWQEGSHPKAILDDVMMVQKLEYTHNNPVKRGLVASPEHWRYSSAHEWLLGAEPLLRCDQSQ